MSACLLSNLHPAAAGTQTLGDLHELDGTHFLKHYLLTLQRVQGDQNLTGPSPAVRSWTHPETFIYQKFPKHKRG